MTIFSTISVRIATSRGACSVCKSERSEIAYAIFNDMAATERTYTGAEACPFCVDRLGIPKAIMRALDNQERCELSFTEDERGTSDADVKAEYASLRKAISDGKADMMPAIPAGAFYCKRLWRSKEVA